MTRPITQTLFVIFLFVSGAFRSQTGDAVQPWNLPRFGDDATTLYTAAANIPYAAGTDVLVIDDEESYVFDGQGKSVLTRYMLYKVLTQRGAEGWDGVSNPWEPWHEERPVVRARVITPDYAIHTLDQKTITDAPAKEDEDQVYSDRRVLRAPLPAIAVGSLVEEEAIVTENKALFGSGTVARSYFGRSVPVHFTRLTLDSPASLPIRYELQLLTDLKPERSEVDGRVRLVFEQGLIEPRDEPVTQAPSDVALYPNVVFSTADSWQKIAAEYGKIVDTQVASSDVKPLVQKLIAGKESRESKASAVLQYLDREVRYTGVEFGDAAITPRTPAETLKRKYGDCKDKAALLVAMLRAAGIPSYVALLNAGARQDVSAEIPGMGLFDHAIVFVPGSPELWIDATDERARLGQLPSADQGRFALIARGETSSVVRIPETSSSENLLVEKREFHLAENGPARIVEISEPHGSLESPYRSYFSDPEGKELHKELNDYVKSQYLAERLDHVERSDPSDTSKQFTLRLEANRGKRGSTELDGAVIAIRLETIFERLPAELQQRERVDKKDPSATDKPIKPRTIDYQLSSAFATEWQYRVIPPEGYQPKPLPPDKKIALGPAQLTEKFTSETDGTVQGVIRFEMPKRRFSASEGAELRDKVAEVREGQPILIYFEPTAQTLLNAGKYRESFAAYRSSIALHPNDPIRHLQMAKALLGAGMGQAARDEARLAVQLDPKSALAQKTLAEIFEYDLVGRKFRRGGDYTGAEEAYRGAKKLDADDASIPGNLAILLEYNSDGERYGRGARLKDAIAEYRSIKPEDLADIGLKNNLAFALFYAGESAETRKYAESLNPQPNGLIVAAETAMNGAAAGLAEASKRTSSDTDRKDVLKAAGNMLMQARKYSQAADLLEGAASGNNASNTMSLVSMLRKARPFEEIQYPDDPRGVAMRAFLLTADPDLTVDKLIAIYSRNAVKVVHSTDREELKQALSAGRRMRRGLASNGFSSDVMLDLVVQTVETTTEGDDASGYRVNLKIPGSNNTVMYVVKEDGKYKILDSGEKPNSIGLEALDRIAAGNLTGAQVLLDWVRDGQHIAGGDDPMVGYAFPHIWTKGKPGDADHMKIAAAAILDQTRATAAQGVPILEAALKSAATDGDRTNILQALRTGYFNLQDYAKLLEVANQLEKQYPDSKNILFNQQAALRGLGRFQDAEAQANNWLKRFPDDIEGQRYLILSAASREDYALAHSLALKLASSGKAEASDLNGAAWNALFTAKVDDNDVQMATRAAQMTQQRDTSILHTLGCVYAEVGKTKQAREVLIQSMDQLNLDEPDSNYWYALGRVAEQYGEDKIASGDYSKVEKPARVIEIPDSSYRLAQNRLKVMGNSSASGKPAKN
jgi:transglutaminase-like putative cysteine protease/tetratricopeptide (TPR) repeat protein